MKVLHFYSNIASQMPPTMIGLKSLGVESRAISFGKDHVQEGHGFVRYIDLDNFFDLIYLVRSLFWCDLIHWYFCVDLSELFPHRRWILSLVKRRKTIFEGWGSDIRVERIALIGNGPLRSYFEANEYSAVSLRAIGSEAISFQAQRSIASFGGKLMVPYSELIDYVEPSVFPNPFISRVRLNLDWYQPNFIENEIPVIIHSPTNKEIKGSIFVAEAMEQLKMDGFVFEFIEIYDMKHDEAMEIFRKADILIDQIIIGDAGVAAREAMAFGKIVIGYLTERVKKIYGPEFPLVVADRTTLKDVLASLLRDPQRRKEIRLKSRQYVEKYHDCKKVAQQIYDCYKAL